MSMNQSTGSTEMDYVIITDSDEDIIFIPPPRHPIQNLSNNGFFQELNLEEEDKLGEQLSSHDSIERMQVDKNSTKSDDDDVVFIPGPKPPLYILDSSGDEQIDESDSKNHKTTVCDLLEPKLIKVLASKTHDLHDGTAFIDVATKATKRTKKFTKNLERNSDRVLLKKQKSSGTDCGSSDSDVVCNKSDTPRGTKRNSDNKRISCKTLRKYKQKPSMNIDIDVHSSLQQLSDIDRDAAVMKTNVSDSSKLYQIIPYNKNSDDTNDANRNSVGRSGNVIGKTINEENWDEDDESKESSVKERDQTYRESNETNRHLLERNSVNCGNTSREENWDEEDEQQNISVQGGNQNWCKNNESNTYFGETTSYICRNNWENSEVAGNQSEPNRNFVERSKNNSIEEENWDDDDEPSENCAAAVDQNWGKTNEQNQPSNKNFVDRSSSNSRNTIEEENWDEDDEPSENSAEKANIGRNNSNDCVRRKSYNIPDGKGGNNDKHTNDPNHWSIVKDDIHAVHTVKRGPMCYNCREQGHRWNNCPQPRKPISCYTCGHKGHSYNRCSNAICLKCGDKTVSYSRGCKNCQHLANIKCSNCGVRGHDELNCSDSWRRYHNTINTLSVPRPLPIQKSAKYCSVCAGVGHVAEFCYDAFELLGEEMPSTRIQKYGPDYKTNFTKNRATKPSKELSLFKSLAQKSKRYTFTANVRRNDVKMVVNPMILKNVGKRTKNINPFSKKFRFALSASVSESDEPSSSSVNVHKPKNQVDITMKKTMTVSMNTVESLAFNALMQQAIEIDKLTCPAFYPEVDENTRKMKELMELERTLHTMKKRLNTIIQSEDQNKVNTTENSNVHDHFSVEEETNDVNFLDSIQLNSTVIASINGYDERTKSDKPIMETKKIYLTKDHSRLLNEEHEPINDTLTVVGTKDNQDKFHANLIEHLEDHSYKKVHLKNEKIHQLPESREGLIAFIREKINAMEQPWVDLEELYENMKINENLKCKKANEIRKQLNVNLFGRAGLRDGAVHLVGLQNNLKVLLRNTKGDISKEMRKDVYEHYRYIFSSYSHDNYPELISIYNELKNKNKK